MLPRVQSLGTFKKGSFFSVTPLGSGSLQRKEEMLLDRLPVVLAHINAVDADLCGDAVFASLHSHRKVWVGRGLNFSAMAGTRPCTRPSWSKFHQICPWTLPHCAFQPLNCPQNVIGFWLVRMSECAWEGSDSFAHWCSVYSDLRILCLGQGVACGLHFDFMMACFIKWEKIYSQCYFLLLK